MDELDTLLSRLDWNRTYLQGRNHLWRAGSDNPVPGTTIQEDKRREAQSITDAKLAAAVRAEKHKRGPAAQTKVDAVTRFEGLIHDHHFGGLVQQVEDTLDDRRQLKAFYDEYRKEKVVEDATMFRMIKQGEFGKVRRLFELGEINPNAAEPINLMTGLMKAVQLCRPKIVRLFLENHADANQENRFGQVAFHYLWDAWRRVPSDSLFKVVKLMHTIMIAEALLQYNANPDIIIPESGMTPLHVAAQYGHAQIAQLILMYKGSRAITDSQGRTALDVCEEFGSTEVAGLIKNWTKISGQFATTEFRHKWETFFAHDQRLSSFPEAKTLITDLNVREKAMADFKISEVPMLDELAMAEKAREQRKLRDRKKARDKARLAEFQATKAHAEKSSLAEQLMSQDKIAHGDAPVTMATAMALNVGRYVRTRETRAPRRLKPGKGSDNAALLNTLAHSRRKRAVQYDFNKRLAKAAGRYEDPDEMTVEQIFGRKAVQGAPPASSSKPLTATATATPSPKGSSPSTHPRASALATADDGGGGGKEGGDTEAAALPPRPPNAASSRNVVSSPAPRPGSGGLPAPPRPGSAGSTNSGRPGSGRSSRPGSGRSSRPGSGRSSRPGSGRSSRPGSGRSSRPGSGRSSRPGSGRRSMRMAGAASLRRSSRGSACTMWSGFTQASTMSTASSRASQAVANMRHRRRFAARNVAEDAYAGRLTKTYSDGDTYIRKSALTSVTMRGTRQRVEIDPLQLKNKLGVRAGEGGASGAMIGALLSGGSPSKAAKTDADKLHDNLKPRRELEAQDIGQVLRSYCGEKLLPPSIQKVMDKPKTLLEKQVAREEAKRQQLAANKYDVVFREKKARTMYRNQFGKMEDPWAHAKLDSKALVQLAH